MLRDNIAIHLSNTFNWRPHLACVVIYVVNAKSCLLRDVLSLNINDHPLNCVVANQSSK